jgi:hypothetical protein
MYFVEMRSFSFDESRYANATVDYKAKKMGQGDIYQCFKLPGNATSLSGGSLSDGAIVPDYGDTLNVQIIAADVRRNTSTIDITVIRLPVKKQEDKTAALPSPRPLFMTAAVYVPPHAYYADVLEKIALDSTSSTVSDVLHFHDDVIPLHLPAEIKLLAKKLPAALYPKTVMVHKSFAGTEKALTTKNEGPWFTASNREAGDYYLKVDTIQPTIEHINFDISSQTFSNDTIKLTIKDELSGIEKYDAYLNDQWIPMEYDAKNDLLFWALEPPYTGKKQIIKLTVTDAVGNTNTSTIEFRQ